MKKLLVLVFALFTVFALASCGHKHTLEEHKEVAAQCEQAGKKAYWSCAECGKLFADANGEQEVAEADLVIAAKDHTVEVIAAVEPTCTEKGLTAGKKCSVCGKVLEEQKDVPAKGHTEEVIAAVEPTCTEKGLSEGKKCSVCGEILVPQQEVEALGHELYKVAETDSNELVNGCIEHYACERCDARFLDAEGEQEVELDDVLKPLADKLAVEEGLEDPDGKYLFAVGGFGSWDPNEDTMMKGATTVAAVKALNEDLGKALEERAESIKSLYYSIIIVGLEDAGWTTNALYQNALVQMNGSFTVKAIKGQYDEDAESYSKDQWIPDPHTAHAESLTPNSLFIAANWAEKSDELGFDWQANPVALQGAGVYYFICADYGKASTSEVYGYGLGLVKVIDLESEEGVQDRIPANDELAVEEGGLAAAEGTYYFAVGGFGSWDPSEDTMMQGATTVAAVKALDENLGKALEDKGEDLKALYYSIIKVGAGDAGWSTNAKVDGKLYSYNGSFTVKTIKGSYDEDAESYSKDQWIPDPHTAHVESLTPATLFIASNWAEKADEDGFTWAANPVVTGGAGWYYLIVADYGQASTTEVYGYGMALVKICDCESTAPAPVELKDLVLANHTFGVIGGFAASGWNTDVAMTKVEGENKYQATVELTAGDELKVRADGAWGDNWGVEGYNAPNNFKVEEDGTYLVTLSFESDVVAFTSEGFPGVVTVEKQ